MALDISKLQNPRAGTNGSRTFACPACREQDRDSTGNHLIIYADGKFGCAANANDPDHRSRIWALVGDGSSGGGAAPVDAPTRRTQISLPTIYPPSVLKRLVHDYSYWESRGISAETVAPFRGGVATQFQMKDRWVFPQFNDNGDIIGFSGRCLRTMTDAERKQWKRPKWKHLTPSSLFLWGDFDAIEENGRVLLVESIGDGLAAREHGVTENACLFGTNLSAVLLGKLIALNPSEIVISTNNDVGHHTGQNVGAVAAAKIEKVLLSFFDRRQIRILLPLAKDLGAQNSDQWKSWRNLLDTTRYTATLHDSPAGSSAARDDNHDSPLQQSDAPTEDVLEIDLFE